MKLLEFAQEHTAVTAPSYANSRVAVALSVVCLLATSQALAKVEFGRDIQPLLRKHCIECHGPAQQMRGLRFDRRVSALPNRIGANGVRIVPGNSAGSVFYKRISGNAGGPQMPPSGPLTPSEIALFKAWIDEGVDWPDALSGERLASAADPVAERIGSALRAGRRGALASILRERPAAIGAKGRAGWTPLHYAAMYGTAADLRWLLDRGAKVNELNDDGATALHYAVDDAAKTRLMLDRGADVNLRSSQGRTALMVAAGLNGTIESVRMLLDAKASLPSEGIGPVGLAAQSGNLAVVRLLVERGLARKPLVVSARTCRPCVDLLLPMADERETTGALNAALSTGDLPLVNELLSRGAKAGPSFLQQAAVSPNAFPAETIHTLIARGARLDVKTSFGVSIADFAARQGNAEMAEVLRAAGAPADVAAPPALQPKAAASLRAAVERSLPLLQRTDVSFFQKARCVSCHNNSLTAMTVQAAREKGLRVDNATANEQSRLIARFLLENGAGGMENIGIPGGVDTVSYILLGLAADRYPADVATDLWARYLKNLQREDGSWGIQTNRPPLESSDFQNTAAVLRVLAVYAPPAQGAVYAKSVAAAVRWLETAQPRSTEDSAFQILGLVWGGGSKSAVRQAALALLAAQRQDGGWSQNARLGSDAYATGQALTAIGASKAVATGDPRLERGRRYLLESQMEDGSWFVRSRAASFQPYFDSGFPYEHDQFISAAATNWAAMALLAGIP